MSKRKHIVKVTVRGKVETHEFKTKGEKLAFVRGLSTLGWSTYEFEDEIGVAGGTLKAGVDEVVTWLTGKRA